MINTEITKTDKALFLNIYDRRSIMLSYVYDGREYHGIAKELMPRMICYRTGLKVKRTVITGKHPDGLEVSVEFVQYKDCPVVECSAVFVNTSGQDSKILSDVKIYNSTIKGENPVIITGTGECGDEGFKEFRRPLTEKVTLSPVDGLSMSGASPYMKLLFDGYGVNIGIGWAGMWQAEFEPVEDGVRFSLGQKRCHMRLHGGERMRTPRVVMLAYEGEELRGINLWRRWYFRYLMPAEVKSPMLALHTFHINDKEEFIGADEQNQYVGIDSYINHGMKPDIWWIDAGWYRCPDEHWDTNVGTWRPDPMRFPDGFRPVSRKCRKEGIKLLLWFEPERAMKGTFIETEHPEYLLKWSERPDMFAVNFSDSECVEWMISYIGDYLRENKIHIYRQDMNFPILPYWEQAESEDRIGAVENRYVQGLMAFWDGLKKKRPGLIIDNCSSGGRRNDLDTMSRAVTLHYTDNGYGIHPVKQAQHDYMFRWIPYFRAHNMSWDDENGNYTVGHDHGVDRFAYHCAMTPSLTSMTEYNASEEEFSLGVDMIAIWRKAAQYMMSGDYYPLTECRRRSEDWYAVQFDKDCGAEGYIQVIRNIRAEGDSFTVFPQLDFSETYFFVNPETKEKRVLKGSDLKNGFTVSMPARSGEVWFYEKQDNRVLAGVYDEKTDVK